MIISDDVAPFDVMAYETALGGLSFSEKISDCRRFSELSDVASISKLLILYVHGDSEITHEVKRNFAWKHKREKADFLTAQLRSSDKVITAGAIELLGVLREPSAVPSLDAIFDVRDTAQAARIIDALCEISEQLSAGIIMKALASRDDELLFLAVSRLSGMVDYVSWKVFRPLLTHANVKIRGEAFFAVCIRKSPDSAGVLLKAIARESDRSAKLLMIKYVSMLPSRRLVRPLLSMVVHDSDQKARLVASRTLDRLQGLLRPSAIYSLRRASDRALRAEVLFRLGKFGSEIEAHKKYLRTTLAKSGDPLIAQACIQALGNIAERSDIDLLMEYLTRDPFTSYNAAIALTKIFRLGDKDRVLSIAKHTKSHITKQIFLKYLIRRRGLGASASELLDAVRSCLMGENNINARYLAFCLLEFGPSAEVLEFLLVSHVRAESEFEREAIDIALRGLALNHGREFLLLVHSCDDDVCASVIRYLPQNMDEHFYRALAETFYGRYSGPLKSGLEDIFREIFERLMLVPAAIREFVKPLPDASWRIFFMHILTERADLEAIRNVESELVEMLSDDDHEVRAMAMMLILSLKDPSIVPRLIAIAERDPRSKLRSAARYVASTLVKEGII